MGTVTATGGALSDTQVDAGNNLTATTDAQGVYMLTVKETGEYNLKFTATDMESMERPLPQAPPIVHKPL